MGSSLAALGLLLLPIVTHGISSSFQSTKVPREHSYVSPIAGCEGFACVLDYIKLPDEHYTWYDTKLRLEGTVEGGRPGLPPTKWTGYVLNMTSQMWRVKVDFPIWWHTLVVIVPEAAEFRDWATVTLEFGINRGNGFLSRIDNRPSQDEVVVKDASSYEITADNLHSSLDNLGETVREAAFLAARTRAPAVSLANLPNSEETFANDPLHMQRIGDYLKAYTYADFLNHPEEPERIMELPIAKAVVRAMDTVQAFTETLPNGRVERFGVVGYSKLGTATYVAGGADPRVKAIVPASINLEFAFMDPPQNPGPLTSKVAKGLRDKMALVHPTEMQDSYIGVTLSSTTAEFQKLSSIISPIAFKELLGMPKLLPWGTSDWIVNMFEQQVVSLSRELPGQTSFMYVPNTDHDDIIVKSLDSIAAFLRGVLLGQAPPEIWPTYDPGTRTLAVWQGTGQERPVNVRLWSGNRADVGDFWTDEPVQEQGPGSWLWQKTVPPGPNSSNIMAFEFEWPEPGFRYAVTTVKYPPAPSEEGISFPR